VAVDHFLGRLALRALHVADSHDLRVLFPEHRAQVEPTAFADSDCAERDAVAGGYGAVAPKDAGRKKPR
jgi:hypothetical protein